jgi:acetyl-CoA carboxylase beta subunit
MAHNEIVKDLTQDEIIQGLIYLSKKGSVLTKCPHCNILLTLDEVECKVCNTCSNHIDYDNVIWINADSLAKA